MARQRATDTDALVLAAARAFHEKGYHNATIDDVAEAAGISRPTVYKYARGKQHLLDLMVERITADMSRRSREAIRGGTDPADRLRRVVRVQVESAATNRDFYAIVLTEELQASEAARRQFRTWARGVTVQFEALLRDCLAAQRQPSAIDPAIAANLVLSMLTSLYRWYDPTGPMDPDRLTDQILLLVGPLVR